MQPRKRAYDFKVTKLLGPDVHKKIFPLGVVAIQTLYRILHGRGELPICAPELFEQHIAEPGVGLPYPHRIHELLDVVVHAGKGSNPRPIWKSSVKADESGSLRFVCGT
jgi:hypothetical protein